MIKNLKNYVFLALFLFLCAGAFFRFFDLSNTPYWMDEGYTVNAVDSELRNGTREFASVLDSGETYFCPTYCAPTTKIVEYFGHDAASYRILSVFFGLAFIVLVYFFTQSFFGNIPVSLLASFFTAFSYWQIAWSRQARWYTMTEFFFWAALLLFYFFLHAKKNTNKYVYFGSSVVLTLLTIVTHRLPVIMVIWFFLEKKPSKKQILWALAGSCGVILFAEFGLGLHFISHAVKNVELHYTLPYYLNFYLRNYWLFLLLGLYGYFNAEKNLQKKIILLATPFFLYLFFLSFFTDIVHYRYLFHVSVALYIIATVSVFDIIKKINLRYKNTQGKYVSFAFVFGVVAVFFVSGNGVLWPKDFYVLEADNPARMNRPYYAYTPQPNFNAGYSAIRANIKKDDLVISSHPHFNKIFLNVAGYWLKYDYLGIENGKTTITDGKEYYVGASVVNNLDELKKLTSEKHGYILYDYMAADDKIPDETIDFISKNFSLIFFDEKNEYSKVWVYRF